MRLTSSVSVNTEERGHMWVLFYLHIPIVGYMHAPRSIQMNSCLLFFILCFYFTHSIILIHFYESPFFLYFSLFYFPLFAHLFATRHFTFASASRLRACPDISVRADYSAGICFRMPQLICFRDSHVFASIRRGITKYFLARRGQSWNEGHLWSHREIMVGARYMCGEPRNTVSLSSVLDHHWGGELWSTSSIEFLLIIL